ncbi:hypothetical protein [Kytococcus schroeteri]|uniref:hypothetical protein n=1 Tax=Kytococcus schroeteri TaxID=138300 RepID=UPI001144FFD5|nr:hypothetical protein [Kytococcus schroeteri]
MRRTTLALTLALTTPLAPLSAAAGPAAAPGHGGPGGPIHGTYRVTSGADAGRGTLRAGLEAGYSRFEVARTVRTIAVESTLEYAGTRELTIDGHGATLAGDHLRTDLLHVTSGADVTLRDLTLTDGGGWTMDHVATDGEDEGSASALHVEVPAGATGTVDLTLRDVTVDGVAGHGVWVDDNAGSAASVRASVRDTTVRDSGTGAFDRDGVRVDETGEGDLVWAGRDNLFTGIGADGVELDERGAGDAVATSRGTAFTDNGTYCLPLADRTDEEELACVEDGELDLDDGIDVDEADAGSIVARVSRATVTGNADEGLDWDESGTGSVVTDITRSELSGNRDEGFKTTEEDAGDVLVTASRTRVHGNLANDGIQLEEDAAGDVHVALHRVEVTDQAEGDGVKVDEVDAGDLTMLVTRSVFGGNDGQDLDVKQADEGAGWLAVVRSGEVDAKTKGVELR